MGDVSCSPGEAGMESGTAVEQKRVPPSTAPGSPQRLWVSGAGYPQLGVLLTLADLMTFRLPDGLTPTQMGTPLNQVSRRRWRCVCGAYARPQSRSLAGLWAMAGESYGPGLTCSSWLGLPRVYAVPVDNRVCARPSCLCVCTWGACGHAGGVHRGHRHTFVQHLLCASHTSRSHVSVLLECF